MDGIVLVFREDKENYMDNEKIGKFVLELRKQKGITQMELAEKVGVSDKTISKWECGVSQT